MSASVIIKHLVVAAIVYGIGYIIGYFSYVIDLREAQEKTKKLKQFIEYSKETYATWIYNEADDDFYCSNCGGKALCDGDCIGIDWIMQSLSDYCPRCGKKMEGDEK